MMEKTFGYQILLKVLTYNVSVRNILHITASALIIRGRKNCLYIYNIQAVILSTPSLQIHDIHTYIHDILFFGKKSDVAVRVVEADFGCEVDLKTKVSRKIKVDCPL